MTINNIHTPTKNKPTASVTSNFSLTILYIFATKTKTTSIDIPHMNTSTIKFQFSTSHTINAFSITSFTLSNILCSGISHNYRINFAPVAPSGFT